MFVLTKVVLCAAAAVQNQCAVIDRVMYVTEYGVNGCYQRLGGKRMLLEGRLLCFILQLSNHCKCSIKPA